jgi:uncharacterized protein YkwD
MSVPTPVCNGSPRAPRIALLLLLSVTRCGDPEHSPGPSVGTNSNWLRACSTDADCGETHCRCGACSLACASNADCSTLSNARCASGVDAAASSACLTDTATANAGICLPRCAPGGCTEQQSCVAEACVPSAVPAGSFCAAASGRSLADRKREDEILALLEQIRTKGAAGCTGAMPVPEVRLSPRLLCADRVFADDIVKTRSTAPTDSQGRSATDRLSAAGYTPLMWWESNAVGASSAEAAVALMLKDPQACSRWTDGTFTDVGVGVAGDSAVVTLASGR